MSGNDSGGGIAVLIGGVWICVLAYVAAILLVVSIFAVIIGAIFMVGLVLAVIYKSYLAIRDRDMQVLANVLLGLIGGVAALLLFTPKFEGAMGRDFALNLDMAYEGHSSGEGNGIYVLYQFVVGVLAYVGPLALAWAYASQKIEPYREQISVGAIIAWGLGTAAISAAWVIMLSTVHWSNQLGI